MLIPEQRRELQHREIRPLVQDHTARERSLLKLAFVLVIAGHPEEPGYYMGDFMMTLRDLCGHGAERGPHKASD